MLTLQQAEDFEQGSALAKEAFLSTHLGIDARTVHFFDNQLSGVTMPVAYRSGAAYGARSKGWSGILDLSPVVNSSMVVKDFEQALRFFD